MSKKLGVNQVDEEQTCCAMETFTLPILLSLKFMSSKPAHNFDFVKHLLIHNLFDEKLIVMGPDPTQTEHTFTCKK